MDKQEMIELLEDLIEEDRQPDYDEDKWPYDKKPEDWPKDFKDKHFEIIRIKQAIELLPMNLTGEITEEGEYIIRFTPEYER